MTSPTAQFRKRFALAVAFLTLCSGAMSAAGDVDGDGLDEIGVFAIESRGLARGPWLQLFNGSGQAVSSFFLDKQLHDIHFRRLDYDGDGRDEIVVLALRADGQPILEVRDGGGVILAQSPVAEPGALGLELLEIDIDGRSPVEIGVAYTRGPAGVAVVDPLAPLGAGVVQIWARTRVAPGGLSRGAFFEAIPAGFAAHAWRVADVDGDGAQELVACYAQPPSSLLGETASKGAMVRVLRPLGGLLLREISAADETLDGAQWLVGDFVASSVGQELLVGLRRQLDGTGVMRVFDLHAQTGTAPSATASPWLSSRDATPAAVTDLVWRALRRDRPLPAPGVAPEPERHYALVGFRLADGAWAYRVWDPAPSQGAAPDGGEPPQGARSSRMPGAPAGSVTPSDGQPGEVSAVEAPQLPTIGGGTILGAEATVNDWIVGEFDGDMSNGDGVIVLFTRGDRSIGFQHWGQSGFVQAGGGTLFGSTFIDPRGLALRAVQPGREELAIIARTVADAPRLELWHVQGPGTRLLARTVLGPDVR